MEALPEQADQAAGALNRHLVVLRAVGAGEVVVGDEVDDGGQVVAAGGADLLERAAQPRLVGHVGLDEREVVRPSGVALQIEADHVVIGAKALHELHAEQPTRAGDEYDATLFVHGVPLPGAPAGHGPLDVSDRLLQPGA